MTNRNVNANLNLILRLNMIVTQFESDSKCESEPKLTFHSKSESDSNILKGPSQPPPFSMPSKLLILHGATKSYCFTLSCVPGSVFDYL